ncbi:MAG: CAAX prenyl protease-related protein [Kiritimatiellae bacterium]|nr:CAAX prenyl protease-related protein [Kiritimatiellia bacterium]
MAAASEVDARRAMWAHVVPFAAWLAILTLLEQTAWTYALRSAAGLGLLLALRPWRWYARPSLRNMPAAVAVGVLVFIVWVLPESRWLARWPALADLYLKLGVLPPWETFQAPETSPYAPAACGWALAMVRLAGSAFVIAVIEEFFWRGFLYRWLLGKDFLGVDLGTLRWPMLLLVSVLFGFEHDRWLVGIVAGLAYGLLAIRTRDIWAACTAHVVTNLLLGIYVLAAGAYGFW